MPILTSFQTRASLVLKVISSSIRTRIVTAKDWVPTFPAISRIRDWKQTRMATLDTIPSNIPTTLDTNMPRNRRAISHGRRFFMLTARVSFMSSLPSPSAIPASLL